MPDLIRHPPFFFWKGKEGGPRISAGVTILSNQPAYRA